MPLDYTILTQVPLFEGLTENELDQLLSSIYCTEICFHKGDILARIDEPCNRTTILLSGRTKEELSDSSGKVVKVEDMQAPAAIALPFLFNHGGNYPVQITALENGVALIISANGIFEILSTSNIVLKNFLRISARFTYGIIQRLHIMTFLTIRRKISLYLLEQAELSKSDKIKLDLTHIALAEYFGVSRQALEREMHNMVTDGLLKIKGKYITLLHKSKLEFLVKF